jgi:adenine deaminase
LTSSKAWAKLTRKLVDVAAGRSPADIVVRNGKWVCVQSGEILEGTDVAILGERIAYVGPDASHTIGKKTKIIDAEGSYLVPGLLDGHIHIESSMVTITEFVRAVMPHGTTGVFIDPHEIANVMGLQGVDLMVKEAQDQPIHVWVQVPSCVPSAVGLETSREILGPRQIAKALSWSGVIGLGEMMDYDGVIASDKQTHAKLAATRAAGKVIGGHYPPLEMGIPFHAYVAGGAEDDHEGTTKEGAIERARQGMKVMMRLGSAWHDLETQMRAVTEEGLDPRHFILATDDAHAGTLVREGHMDRIVRFAIQKGLDPLVAIQMATLNTAEHFGVAKDVGQIAPGRYADILLVGNLKEFVVEKVLARGEVVAQGSKIIAKMPSFKYPDKALSTVNLARPLIAEDFAVPSQGGGKVDVHVIGVIENQALTRHLRLDLNASDGRVPADLAQDVAKVALVERHHATGEIQVGFVHGFGLNASCAIASTVAHDSHHLIIVGTDDANMAQAANELARMGGGQIVMRDGDVLASIGLPIAGLMSDEPAAAVAEKMSRVLDAFRACGCTLNNANMQLSLLALVVIPELRISNKGIVDVASGKIIPLIATD